MNEKDPTCSDRKCTTIFLMTEEEEISPKKDDKATFRCDVCGIDFKEKETLEAHIDATHNKNRQYTCSECGRSFNRMYHLKRHFKVHENCEELLAAVQGNEKKEKCPICGEVFQKRFQVKQHMAETHGADKVFHCEICGENFKTEHIYKQHCQKMHENPERKLYKCEYCEMTFDKMSLLIKHKHSEHPKPYKCEQCGAEFKRKQGLTEHMKRHSPKEERKVFVCPIEGCGKSFTRKNNLKTHMASIHGGVLPYACDICGKDFLYPSQLAKHKEIAHQDQPEVIELGEDFLDSVQKL